ncbi:MAG: polysaccharide deacetylase family protein [Gemmatimonadota bacterium]|nr:polysaccharide deacetylase family protein [Gemmatimonadota bacterium]
MPSARAYARVALSAVGAVDLARRLRRHSLVICCYHGVREDEDIDATHYLQLPSSAFRAQLKYLETNYECLGIEDAVVRLREGGFSRPTVAITFDDGYRNNLSVALPILRELGIPATVYVATGIIGTTQQLWTTELEYALRQSGERELRLPENIPGIPVRLRSSNAASAALISALKTVPRAIRVAVLDSLRGQLERPSIPSAFEFMTWNDVTALDQTGLVRVGAHTVHHEILSRLPEEAVEMEIVDSIAMVARHVTHPSTTFAYPNGRSEDIGERAVAAVAASGCDAALSTIIGFNDAGTNPFLLKRVVVGAFEHPAVFRARLSGL